jgi:SanA protein
MKRHKLKYIIAILTLTVIALTLTIWANSKIISSSEKYLTDDIDKITDSKVGLLLGTSKNLSNGKKNDFFFNRIDATVELYKRNKIKYIIISGDNSKRNYNEPLDMKTELIQRGVPNDKIFLDYAGFRTFDSVIRAKEIFGQTSFIIISQKFHNERAVYIARQNGIEAFGYNAKEVLAYAGFKTKLREFFARDKVFLDILFNTQPKFLGDKIVIE